MVFGGVESKCLLPYFYYHFTLYHLYIGECSTWHSGRASDSQSRGPGLDPHWWHHVVSLSKSPKYWLKHTCRKG